MVLQVIPEIDSDTSPLYTAAQVRQLDKIAIEQHGIPGYELMTRAAEACEQAIVERFPAVRNVLIACGVGNNAGDGYVLAGLLAVRGFLVQVFPLGDTHRLTGDALTAFEYAQTQNVALLSQAGWEKALIESDLVVDALLGTGLKGEVREAYREVIYRINDSGRPVVAVDIPSGLDADRGIALGVAVVADLTVTFIGLKRGLFTADGKDSVGNVLLDDLNVPEAVLRSLEADASLLNSVNVLSPELVSRQRHNVHKNRFGHVVIVGGGPGMPGAPLLAAEAALRCGAGLVTVITHPENIGLAQSRLPEVMVVAFDPEKPGESDRLLALASAIVIGPGLGTGSWSQALFQLVIQYDKPMLLDADALNLLSTLKVGYRAANNRVHTPHPGEASRLLLGANESMVVQDDRFAAVKLLERHYGGDWVLKGAGSLISDGDHTHVCPYGNAAMAVAGSGDVLSGVVGGLIGQGLPTIEAARLGVWLHARAGDGLAAREGAIGMLASELIPEIRVILNQWAK